MKTAARIQTVIEILTAYQANLGPFDGFISTYFRARRFIGGSDRRYIQNLCFEVLRNYFFLNQDLPDDIDNQYYFIVLRYLIHVNRYTIEDLNQLTYACVENYTFKPIDPQYAALLTDIIDFGNLSGLPDFLESQISSAYPITDLQQLSKLAPFDIRVNLSKVTRNSIIDYFENLNIALCATPLSPLGIRFEQRLKLEDSPNYSIQDEGSQLLCKLVNPQPGETILDYCAGAGGKSLAVADLSFDQAIIHAYDNDAKKLFELQRRVKLAQLSSIKIISQSDLDSRQQLYDKVIVDVPCSGTGTLRRSPDRKLWLTQKHLDNFINIQQQLLKQAVSFVKPGGLLYYFTCSLLPCENQQQIDKFLISHSDFEPVKQSTYADLLCDVPANRDDLGITFTPWQTGTDGFYGVVLKKN